MLPVIAFLFVMAGNDGPEPKCNHAARMEVAKRYSLEDLDRIAMMEAITRSDVLVRQFNTLKERCLQGKPLSDKGGLKSDD
jgi:hypothetical protein